MTGKSLANDSLAILTGLQVIFANINSIFDPFKVIPGINFVRALSLMTLEEAGAISLPNYTSDTPT